MASPCWTTNTWKASTKAKNSLDNFSTLGASSSCFSRDLSTIGCFRPCLPPFCVGAPKGTIKEFTSPLIQRSESRCVHLIPQLVQEFYPSPSTFEDPQEFLLVNPCSLRPFLSFVWQRKESFHGPLLCSNSPHLSSSSSSWIFMEQVVLPFPPSPLTFGPLHHEAPNQPWFRCDYQLLHSGVLLLLLFGLVLLFGLGFHHNMCVGQQIIRGHLPSNVHLLRMP